MKPLLLLLSLLFLALMPAPPVDAATYTKTGAGSWSDHTKWSPDPGAGNYPCKSGGDLVKIAYDTPTDVSIDCGVSGPLTPYHTAQKIVSMIASSGGSLPTGTYAVSYTLVDANGVEGAMSPAYISVSVASGNQTLTITLPAIPAGAASMNLYASSSNSYPDGMRLYATGITATTYVMNAANWNNNTQAQASAPNLPTQGAALLWTAGNLTFNAGVTARLRGDLRAQVSGVTFAWNPGVSLIFDASAAAAPAAAQYAWVLGQWASPYAPWTWDTTACTQVSPCAMRSNTAGAAAWAVGGGANSVGGGAVFNHNSTNLCKLAFLTVDWMGSATDRSISCGSANNNGAHGNTLLNVIFGGAAGTGFLDLSFASANDSFSMVNVSFKNSLGTFSFNQSSDTFAGTITANHTYVDKILSLNAALITVSGGSVLYSGTSTTAKAMTISDSLVRVWWASNAQPVNQFMYGTTTNSYILADDNWEDEPARLICDVTVTAHCTGHVSSATGNTLTDSGASWTANQFSGGNQNSWSVIITAGTGAGQVRGITFNTATQLTVTMGSTVPPDATSQYAIWIGAGHQHLRHAASTTWTGNIFDYTGTYGGNHCTSPSTGSSTAYAYVYAADTAFRRSMARRGATSLRERMC